MDTIVPSNIPLKQCSAANCKKWYPATPEYFHRDKSSKSGLCHRCKECAKTHTQQHYQERPEYYKEYASTHTEEGNKRTRKYYRAHKEEAKLYRAQYRKKNYERILAWNRQRDAMRRGASGTYTIEQIEELLKLQHHRCYYAACGFAKFAKINGKYVYHIEHTYPLSRAVGTDIPANDISYIVLACPSCNQSKSDKLPHEWPEGGRLF